MELLSFTRVVEISGSCTSYSHIQSLHAILLFILYLIKRHFVNTGYKKNARV